MSDGCKELYDVRLQCSPVSEPVTSLSDIALTDIESSDTATDSAKILGNVAGCNLCTTGLQLT